MPPAFTPHDFVAKWRKVELKERSAAQEHFLDLCRLVGHAPPAEADPAGAWFTFEALAAKELGGEGFADVWKKGYFAWEYKGKHADLDKAYQQLLFYRAALQNPPLLIVSDIDSIVVRTNYTNTVQRTVTITLDDLLTPAGLQHLRNAFFHPEAFKSPQTTAEVTERAAAEFAHIADLLRRYGTQPQHAAHFLIQVLFCLFAEDCALLPEGLFSRLVRQAQKQPAAFGVQMGQLFQAMADGGWFGADQIAHFDGRLFATVFIPALDSDSLDILAGITALDWSSIEPAILGTLFERSLDPAKRSQLGAHYTSREDILLIVEPVLLAPLRRRWEEVREQARALAAKRDAAAGAARGKAQKQLEGLLLGFISELSSTHVLDPACGAPRGAVTIIPEQKGGELVGPAVYLNTAEADPAGGGPQARTRLKPGEHAARGGTPSRPQGCKPKPTYGYARNLCQKRPEGQHPENRWRWGGSHRVANWSHGSWRKAHRLGQTDNG